MSKHKLVYRSTLLVAAAIFVIAARPARAAITITLDSASETVVSPSSAETIFITGTVVNDGPEALMATGSSHTQQALDDTPIAPVYDQIATDFVFDTLIGTFNVGTTTGVQFIAASLDANQAAGDYSFNNTSLFDMPNFSFNLNNADSTDPETVSVNYSISVQPQTAGTSVPEPASLAILGLVGTALQLRRKR